MSRVAPPRSMAVAAECRSRLAPFVGAAMPAFPTNLVNAAQNASENKDMHSPYCWRVLYGVFKICLRERAGQRPITALYYHDKFGFVNQVCPPGLGLFCSSRSTAVGPRARGGWQKRLTGDNANFVRAATCGRPRGSAAESVAGGNVTAGRMWGPGGGGGDGTAGRICGPAVGARAGAEGIMPILSGPRPAAGPVARRQSPWRAATSPRAGSAARRSE